VGPPRRAAPGHGLSSSSHSGAPIDQLVKPVAKGAGGVALAAGAALAGAMWVHALTGFGGAGTDDFFSRWIYDAITLASAVTLLWCGAVRPKARLPWAALGIGMALKLAGDVGYSFEPNLDAVPVPSIYDPLWLAIYPCAYLALLVLIRQRVGKTLLATRLDGVVCGLAAAAVLASVSLPHAIDATSGAPFWETVTNLSYTVCDLILLGAVVSAVALAGWRVERMWMLLAGAVLLWEGGDLIYLLAGSDTAGLVADALICTGAVGFAAAAFADTGAAAPQRHGGAGLLVPVGAGAVALGVVALGAPLHINAAALTLAVGALALVLARMALALSENDRLLARSRVEAETDALTGLPNRRRLKADLAAALHSGEPHVLVLLDLNGFKAYNDAFGHAAGDAVLRRLGTALCEAALPGTVYRMGGDEFCALTSEAADHPGAFSARCAAAMTLHGKGFSITAAHGAVAIPDEHATAAGVLTLADERMYQQKRGGRMPAARQSANVLTAVAEEHAPELVRHMNAVGELAYATAVDLGVAGAELEALRYAAGLHDIGKLAIPDEVLDNPGPLSDEEWELIRRHTIVGERILACAPALERSARLVRWSHERIDGQGYPDGLRGRDIPLAARVIAVANAYDAIVTEQVYQPARSPEQALAELRRCAGTQFDPQVVEALAEVIARLDVPAQVEAPV
jgi:two-component system cell cycle response regulator